MPSDVINLTKLLGNDIIVRPGEAPYRSRGTCLEVSVRIGGVEVFLGRAEDNGAYVSFARRRDAERFIREMTDAEKIALVGTLLGECAERLKQAYQEAQRELAEAHQALKDLYFVTEMVNERK